MSTDTGALQCHEKKTTCSSTVLSSVPKGNHVLNLGKQFEHIVFKPFLILGKSLTVFIVKRHSKKFLEGHKRITAATANDALDLHITRCECQVRNVNESYIQNSYTNLPKFKISGIGYLKIEWCFVKLQVEKGGQIQMFERYFHLLAQKVFVTFTERSEFQPGERVISFRLKK